MNNSDCRQLIIAVALIVFISAACERAAHASGEEFGAGKCDVSLFVLGIGQDAGAPQVGNPGDPAWQDDSLRLLPTSIALIDHRNDTRFLFDPTPAITEQVALLAMLLSDARPGLGLSGIFITHAHIGHYAGLMYLGREAAGTSDVPVYAMPRLQRYLSENGPWSQLVALDNIAIVPMSNKKPVALSSDLTVTPLQVPHRDEYSETVGFLIGTAQRKALFLPDIDSWDEWASDFATDISQLLEDIDVAYLDATFFDNNELPGRDMSRIPHPRVTDSMTRFDTLTPEHRQKVRFIHLNHTNAARFADSPQRREVIERGYRIAARGEHYCLADKEAD